MFSSVGKLAMDFGKQFLIPEQLNRVKIYFYEDYLLQ